MLRREVKAERKIRKALLDWRMLNMQEEIDDYGDTVVDQRSRQSLRDVRVVEQGQVHPVLRDVHQSRVDGQRGGDGQPLPVPEVRAEDG
jgi:hypothetical protein